MITRMIKKKKNIFINLDKILNFNISFIFKIYHVLSYLFYFMLTLYYIFLRKIY